MSDISKCHQFLVHGTDLTGLPHQRPHYVGEHQMEGEKLDIIDLISTMTLGHILRARSSGLELSPPGLLISIKRHLRTIMGKMPKYKNVLIPIQ